MRVLSVLEVCGFGAVSLAFVLIGHLLAGAEAGIAAGLLAGGLSAIYLANAYALAAAPGEEVSGAERP